MMWWQVQNSYEQAGMAYDRALAGAKSDREVYRARLAFLAELDAYLDRKKAA